MKNWFTLLMALYATAAFSQGELMVAPKHAKVDPSHPFPSRAHINKSSVLRSAPSACDTEDMIDYNSYNEVISQQKGLNFNGSWNGQTPEPVVVELTNFVTDATANAANPFYFTYIAEAFDTLAFQDFPNDVTFGYPQSASTVYLDSLGMFMGISGDTAVADGIMTTDSLVFSVYAIDNHVISNNPVTSVVFTGYNGLSQFLTGADYLGYHQIGINYQFNQGEGFFVMVNYINHDTSSHCIWSYTYIDSCGTIVIDGNTYSSPAYPPVFATNTYGGDANKSSTFSGAIGLNGTTPVTGTEANGDAPYGVTPATCGYYYYQNYEILPIIDVCVNFGASVTATAPAGNITTASCPSGTVNLSGAIYGSVGASNTYSPNDLWGNVMNFGTSNAGLNYTWSSSSGSLSANSGQATTLTMPASNSNVTVTLVGTDGTSYDTVNYVLSNDFIDLSVTNNPNPVQLACGTGNTVTLTTGVSGSQGGHSYTWTGTGLDTTGTNATKIKVSSVGTYHVTVTNGAGCTATDSVVVEYPNGISNTVSFTSAPSPICENNPVTFTNTSSNQAGWTSSWTFGDPANGTSTSTDPTYTYTVGGSFHVQVTMDSAGCNFESPAVSVIVYTPQNNVACVTAIADVPFDNSISVLPNPSNGNVNMIINGIQGNILIRVYNILGSEVYNYQAAELPAVFNKSFDFGNLANGTYLVKIQSGNETAVKRLVITK